MTPDSGPPDSRPSEPVPETTPGGDAGASAALDFDRIIRYVQGHCTDTEHAEVTSAIQADADTRRLVAALQETRWDVDQQLAHALALVDASLDISIDANHAGARDADRHPRHRVTGRSVSRWKGGIGAALAVAATGAAVAIALHTRAPAHENATRRYVTGTGEIATITLPDGSRMTLAPRTTIQLASGFGHASRDIALSGEARFDIHNTSAAPFVVRTGAVTVRVLGTDFAVHRYPGEASGWVRVTTGKVAATAAAHAETFAAGAMGRFTDSTVQTVTETELTATTDWTTGHLVFQDAAVPEVLATLERWYGYQFRLADSVLATRHVTTVFTVNAREETLQRLKQLLQVTITVNGSVITLHRKHENDTPADARSEKTRRSTNQYLTREVGR